MDVDFLQFALRHQPFRPFTMHLADGRALPVKHPEFVAAHPRRVIVIADDGDWTVLEPRLIDALVYNSPPPSDTNGCGRKKKRDS